VYCYLSLKSNDLKGVDNIFICAIMAANSQVAYMAHPIILLSRKK